MLCHDDGRHWSRFDDRRSPFPRHIARWILSQTYRSSPQWGGIAYCLPHVNLHLATFCGHVPKEAPTNYINWDTKSPAPLRFIVAAASGQNLFDFVNRCTSPLMASLFQKWVSLKHKTKWNMYTHILLLLFYNNLYYWSGALLKK